MDDDTDSLSQRVVEGSLEAVCLRAHLYPVRNIDEIMLATSVLAT